MKVVNKKSKAAAHLEDLADINFLPGVLIAFCRHRLHQQASPEGHFVGKHLASAGAPAGYSHSCAVDAVEKHSLTRAQHLLPGGRPALVQHRVGVDQVHLLVSSSDQIKKAAVSSSAPLYVPEDNNSLSAPAAARLAFQVLAQEDPARLLKKLGSEPF